MPIGRAITAPMATASTEIWMCSSSRVGMPSGPLQCDGAANHLKRLSIAAMSGAPRPRDGQALHTGQKQVGHECERDRERRRDHERRSEIVDEPLQDELTEAAKPNHRG